MIAAGMRHWWRMSPRRLLSVSATATAVIVGALLVGDSMRGSLRGLTVERLGKPKTAVIPGGFFDADGITTDGIEAIPADPVRQRHGGISRRARGGDSPGRGSPDHRMRSEFLGPRCRAGIGRSNLPGEDTVVLNESTAAELGVGLAIWITIRLPVEQAVPADSPLGRRDIQSEGLPRMEVSISFPIVGWDALRSHRVRRRQRTSLSVGRRSATCSTGAGQANMLLFDRQITIEDLQIDLADLGLTLKRVRRDSPADADTAETIYDYYSLTSDRLLLPEAAVERVHARISRLASRAESPHLFGQRDRDGWTIRATLLHRFPTARSRRSIRVRRCR